MAGPAILESYPCESHKELVDAGVTYDGTRRYSGTGITGTIAGGMDVEGLSLSFPFNNLPSYHSSSYFFSLSSSLLQTSTNRKV